MADIILVEDEEILRRTLARALVKDSDLVLLDDEEVGDGNADDDELATVGVLVFDRTRLFDRRFEFLERIEPLADHARSRLLGHREQGGEPVLT